MQPSNRELDVLETAGHSFEIITLEPAGEMWRCKMAIDGVIAPEFYEPKAHVVDMNTDDFLRYMQSQALGMLEYSRGKVN